MNAKIYYWKEIKKWLLEVTMRRSFPTKEDIKKDYVQLPFTLEIEGKDELDRIFEQLNVGDNPLATTENQEWLKANEVCHTSMSVGDVVQLDDQYFVCAGVGWEEIEH